MSFSRDQAEWLLGCIDHTLDDCYPVRLDADGTELSHANQQSVIRQLCEAADIDPTTYRWLNDGRPA